MAAVTAIAVAAVGTDGSAAVSTTTPQLATTTTDCTEINRRLP
jgi:hypothetical protein